MNYNDLAIEYTKIVWSQHNRPGDKHHISRVYLFSQNVINIVLQHSIQDCVKIVFSLVRFNAIGDNTKSLTDSGNPKKSWKWTIRASRSFWALKDRWYHFVIIIQIVWYNQALLMGKHPKSYIQAFFRVFGP